MEINFDILKICRTCESSDELVLVDSVQNLHQMLKTYFNLYPLPQQEVICQSCLDFIHNFKEFDLKCQETDTKLREKLKSTVKFEVIEEVEMPEAKSISRCQSESSHSFEDALEVAEETEIDCKPISVFEAENPLCPISTTERSTKYIKTVCLERISVPQSVQQEYQSSKEIFTCDICNEKITGKYRLRGHMKLCHSAPRTNTKATTSNNVERQIPAKVKRIENTKISNNSTETPKVAKVKPNNSYKPRGFYICDICKFEYTFKDSLATHFKTYHRTVFDCNKCTEEFDSDYQLWLHIVKLHDKSSQFIYCFYCRKPQIKDHLIDHLVSHEMNVEMVKNDLKDFENDSSAISIASESVRQQLEESNCKCLTCNLSFRKRQPLINHIIQTHGVKQHPRRRVKDFEDDVKELMANSKEQTGYRCQTCKKFFLNNATRKNDSYGKLRNHIIRLHMMKTFGCSVCKKTFALQEKLDQHVKEHQETKRYSCDICKKNFKSLPRIRIHMQTHLKDPRFFCDFCGKGFTRYGTFMQHKSLLHNPSRKKQVRQCTHCGKSFTSVDGFKRHVARHEGTFIKLHCKICRKVFFSESSREKHMKTQHK